ncbi:SWIM zinc finger family protein [Cylindrospermopsis curvispora]|uniref:SWIM zinc finger family protein n=1 Tax=Cylindrospermopsis curvispora GIHE-G1 TaxID=2666332 RepID=A0A7H0F3C6_9CYAN|nr:SWIM zinc finger family protein [Cylindrospermopsis curvispora]QNP30542.1 SWIM zinc finger family protein [Cylindrospermopsis curvispora GIHE-G1]
MIERTLEISREWWSQRWLDLLDSYRFKKRLERARNYSRQGNILSIEFQKSKVLGRVKGSEVEPYQVSLSLDIFSDEEWSYVIETMSRKSLFAAKLLAGEMPQNIEDVFTSNGLSLFPFTLNDVHSQCSCPDPAVPCKHIGAVYYQLSDRLSEDPFVLFELRGRSRERIIQDLRKLRSQKKLVNPPVQRLYTSEKNNQEENSPKLNTNPNPNQINDFWQYNDPLESSLVVISPNMGETVLDILGNIPLPKDQDNTVHVLGSSNDPTMKHLQNIYRDVSQKACLLAMNMG